ncbi:hypothetical protein H6S82_30985 [Planktothrix sp. FACHB-1355]|uniref:Uncharacterized protein n=1 Tax=Aerosakkonema funiforme FACHB-1375 TaxID=2949571 RepID=A0A926ZG54_9CYAN|nr:MULTISPECIES: hypothetical protein [Oscillatoriales]MBD2181595.1 hypothetical protein [Aerosakkonema funiforme FACHB-1375]MBD3563230.1 hypothetical protein [Planktothrix sp. FACHB-1355]
MQNSILRACMDNQVKYLDDAYAGCKVLAYYAFCWAGSPHCTVRSVWVVHQNILSLLVRLPRGAGTVKPANRRTCVWLCFHSQARELAEIGNLSSNAEIHPLYLGVNRGSRSIKL